MMSEPGVSQLIEGLRIELGLAPAPVAQPTAAGIAALTSPASN
jgi:hypothetical protein